MQNTPIADLLTELETPKTPLIEGIARNPETPAVSPFNTSISFLSNRMEDTLLNLEETPSVTWDMLSSLEEIPVVTEAKTAAIPDMLLSLEASPVARTILDVSVVPKSPASNLAANLKAGLRFLSHYVAVSSIVFAVLLVATNWSAYYTVVLNYVSPGEVLAANQQIQETLSNSKITVYADESGTSAFEKNEKAEDIKKQLDAENIQVDEEPFSMKNLIPTEPNISAKFNITPYENRIIIPKIGKNIPLVDISITKSFDFDHMENIFMTELEKGVVRYPGSAAPGEKGNAFVFGHSSNYPWMKGNYNEVFALLDNVEFGDQIIVFYNQKKFVYTVREKKIVRPGDVKALERNPEATELSLMTCWPIGTTLKRMLVFAELTETH
jgi:sortase A